MISLFINGTSAKDIVSLYKLASSSIRKVKNFTKVYFPSFSVFLYCPSKYYLKIRLRYIKGKPEQEHGI